MINPFAVPLTENEKQAARRFQAYCRAEAARLNRIQKQKEKQ